MLAPLQVCPADGEDAEGSGCAPAHRESAVFNVGVTTQAGAKTSSVPSQLHAESLHVIVPTFHIPPPYFPHCSCAFPNPFTEIAQQTPLTISEDQIQHVIPGLQVFVFFLALDSTDKPSPSLPRHHCLWTLPGSTPPSQSSGFLSSAFPFSAHLYLSRHNLPGVPFRCCAFSYGHGAGIFTLIFTSDYV